MNIKEAIDNLESRLEYPDYEFPVEEVKFLIELARAIRSIEYVPKDGTHILLNVHEYWIEGWFNIKRNRFDYAWLPSHGIGDCGYDDPEPIAWMPLPQLPKDEK